MASKAVLTIGQYAAKKIVQAFVNQLEIRQEKRITKLESTNNSRVKAIFLIALTAIFNYN